MDKRSASAAEPMQRRSVQPPQRDFVLARASQTALPVPTQEPVGERACATSACPSGEGSVQGHFEIAIPPSWASRHTPDTDLDGEILAWIASHVPNRKALKIPH